MVYENASISGICLNTLNNIDPLVTGWTPVAHDHIALKHNQGMEEEKQACGHRWKPFSHSGLMSYGGT